MMGLVQSTEVKVVPGMSASYPLSRDHKKSCTMCVFLTIFNFPLVFRIAPMFFVVPADWGPPYFSPWDRVHSPVGLFLFYMAVVMWEGCACFLYNRLLCRVCTMYSSSYLFSRNGLLTCTNATFSCRGNLPTPPRLKRGPPKRTFCAMYVSELLLFGGNKETVNLHTKKQVNTQHTPKPHMGGPHRAFSC